MSALRSLAWEGESLRLLDQTKLPTEITYLNCRDYREVADAIRILAVRGAPAIGVAAAYAVLLAYRECLLSSDISAAFHQACQEISAARPTAVNLAFGVLSVLHERGAIECVYADETRPLLQGSRLTATELMEGHIPCCLISDTMSASVMRDKKIDAIIVGADRIAANGDTANKIGTYGLAVMAAYHHIPFYIAAPFSTFDFSIASGKEIVIEERDPDEVRQFAGVYSAPKDVPVYNPAFDVTPSSLIAGIITEKGVLKAPYEAAIEKYKKELSK